MDAMSTDQIARLNELYRANDGTYVFGWETGGFDDQVQELNLSGE